LRRPQFSLFPENKEIAMFRLLGTAIYYAAGPIAKVTLGVAGAAIKGTASAVGGTIEGISYAAELQRRSDWDNVTGCGQYPQAWDVYEQSGYESAMKFKDGLKAADKTENRSIHQTLTQTTDTTSAITHLHLVCPSISDTAKIVDPSNNLTILDNVSTDKQSSIVDIDPDPNSYVTVQGQYAIINEGISYKIINTQTKQIIAQNISSFLDCVKTLEYVFEKSDSHNESKNSIIAPQNRESKSVSSVIPSNLINDTHEQLDEFDLALVKSLVSYFENMPGKIRHYHKDHNASREEAELIAEYYLETANFVKNVKTRNDLEELLKSLEILKDKISRYQHKSYKYRWSTSLETEVLVKLGKVMDALKH
jgi:hypothetical protein